MKHKEPGNKRAAAWIAMAASLATAHAVKATTYSWTGNGADALWTDASDWTGNSGHYPVSGDTAVFNSNPANGLSAISLGQGTQGLTNLTFTNGAAAYTIGVLNSNDQLNFNANGMIYASSNLATAEVINANVSTAGAMTITSGDMATVTVGGNIALGGNLTISGASNSATAITINGAISGNYSVTLANTNNFTSNSVGLATLNLLGRNTYSGGTILSATATIIPITYTPTNMTYGVFGTGTINFDNSTNQRLRPVGNQIIYNSITLTTGMETDSSTSNDTSSLTYAGPITFGDTSRYFSNGDPSDGSSLFGATMILGLAMSPSTITMPDATGQTVSFDAVSGPIILNDVMQDAGTNVSAVVLNPGSNNNYPIVINSLNTYAGDTNFGNKDVENTSFIGIGASTVSSGTAVLSGPFGTGKLIMDNTTSPPILEPYGADRTVANAITMTSGFIAANASVADDPTGPHNLTLTGAISLTTSSRYLINNMVAGEVLTLGNATAASTIALGSTGGQMLTFESQATAGGGVTIVNDVIQNASGGGSGTVSLVTGTTYLNANNTFSGGLFISGGTAIISADLNMGSATGTLTLNSGSLLDTGTFTSARPIALTGTTATIDVSGGQTLALTGAFSGTGDLDKGTNTGTLQLAQSNGASISGNVNVNGGMVIFGASSTGATNPLNVGGSLIIQSGAKFAVLSGGAVTSGVTNTIFNLALFGGGQADLANSGLITSTLFPTVRQYLINGYNNGAWNGTGGIDSINAATNTSHQTALGYTTGTSSVGQGLHLGLNQTLVKYTLYGDANLDGTVDINDLNIVLSNLLSGNPATWDTGDFFYAGQTDISDLNAVLSNFFDSAPTTVRAAKAAAKASASTASTAKTLTGTVSPADTVNPPPANGVLELVVNIYTGDVELEGNNADIASLQITSASGSIITANWTDLHANGYTNWSDTAKKKTGIGEYDNQFTATGDYAVLGVVDYGDIYNTTVNAEDYVFKYGSVESNDTTVDTDTGSVLYVGVPEPTTLSLMGLAAAGLMGRRRKSRSR